MTDSPATVYYSDGAKQRAFDMLLSNLHLVTYNLTGLSVTFMPAPTLLTTRPASSAYCLHLGAHEPAFFCDDYCDHPPQRLQPSRQARPNVLWRDASHDAEYVRPRRALIVPIDMRRAAAKAAVAHKEHPFVSLLVSGEHGVYIQHHRTWLPPHVIALFPLAAEPVPRDDDVTLRIDSLGVIFSPHHEEHAIERWAARNKSGGCPLFFGSVDGFVAAFPDPHCDRTESNACSVPIDYSPAASPHSIGDTPQPSAPSRRLSYTGDAQPDGAAEDGLFDEVVPADEPDLKRKRAE